MDAPFNPLKHISYFNKIEKSFYCEDWKLNRGKNFKIQFKDIVKGDPKDDRQAERMISVDGEVWEYQKFVSMKVLDEGIEYLFDARRYFKGFKSFGETKSKPNKWT